MEPAAHQYEKELEFGRRFLGIHPPPGEVVFCALSGAHLYGFPSADSDLDLKGAYLAPTDSLLGLRPQSKAHDCLARLDGIECDLTTLELAKSLRLLLGGNGNTLEQILSPHQLVATPDLGELRHLGQGALSAQFARHYQGFLRGLRREFEREALPEVKTVLYGLRVAGTGLRLLCEQRVEADLRHLTEVHDLADLEVLIQRKCGSKEHVRLNQREKELMLPIWDRLESRLTTASEQTRLPPAPLNTEAVESWLIGLRKRRA